MKKPDSFFVKKIHQLAKKAVIVDIGGGHPFQRELAEFKPLFNNKLFFTIDYAPTFKPTIVGDAQILPLKNKSVDALICHSVLEHVPKPWEAVNEMHRILKPGGKAFVYAPFLFVYHAGPNFKDYYRFSIDAWKELFKDFKKIEIHPARGYIETILKLFPNTIFTKLRPLAIFLDKIMKTNNFHWSSRQVSGYYIFATK